MSTALKAAPFVCLIPAGIIVSLSPVSYTTKGTRTARPLFSHGTQRVPEVLHYLYLSVYVSLSMNSFICAPLRKRVQRYTFYHYAPNFPAGIFWAARTTKLHNSHQTSKECVVKHGINSRKHPQKTAQTFFAIPTLRPHPPPHIGAATSSCPTVCGPPSHHQPRAFPIYNKERARKTAPQGGAYSTPLLDGNS